MEGELISSVVSWLQGNNLNELHDFNEFIDPGKRALEKFRDRAIETYPELEQYATIKLEPKFSESYCLRITAVKRFCKIYFRDQNQFPICEFYWEDFYVFEFYMGNNLEAALILKRWFCENVMPSVLAQEFSWLDKDNLFTYYDLGKVIEADFIRSWDEIEQFYKEFSKYYQNLDVSKILKLIDQMRKKGFDKTLRVGSSLAALVLSRSRHHGLRAEQPSLTFEFNTNSLTIFTSQKARVSGGMGLYSSKFKITPEIERLMKELETRDIN